MSHHCKGHIARRIKARAAKVRDALGARLSHCGVVIALLFFSASITPSLVPRAYHLQGLLSGIALVAGYSVGVVGVYLWQFLELPQPRYRYTRRAKAVLLIGVFLLALMVLLRVEVWQNSVRDLMGVEPITDGYQFRILLIAVPVALFMLVLARGFGLCVKIVQRRLVRLVPYKISVVVSVAATAFVIVTVFNGTLERWGLQLADSTAFQLDQLVEDDIVPPSGAFSTGGPDSLISWDKIGRKGKHFLVLGPTKDEISEVTQKPSIAPIRVYAGLGAGETPEERAELALSELKRVGGFDRSVLIVATPTGTGWLDPAAVDTIEFLHRGDSAIVAVQYSYLPSSFSLIFEPDYAQDTARALFDAVYRYWTTLPVESRPRFYLHGLSLGSSGSEEATKLVTILGDLIHGAVWSGPPFTNRIKRDATRNRNLDSPAWLPVVANSAMIRFTAQENSLDIEGATWGPLRIVYIQYASDPIAFFSTDLALRKPDWLRGERGPDVSPYLDWYPIVTFLQVGFDMLTSTSKKPGFGHTYSAENYIDAWLEVTEPEGWSEAEITQLKAHFRK